MARHRNACLTAGLDEFFHLADDSEADWEHTVSWIDCMSGGASARPVHARQPGTASARQRTARARKLTVPIVPPVSLVNRLTLRPFNMCLLPPQEVAGGPRLAHYEPFFYPLDNLLEWNRMYGPRGFFQYQCVVPRKSGHDCDCRPCWPRSRAPARALSSPC